MDLFALCSAKTSLCNKLLVAEAQQVSPGCDRASDGRVALNQSFHLPLTCFYTPFLRFNTPLLHRKNINNLREVSFQAMNMGTYRHVIRVESKTLEIVSSKCC